MGITARRFRARPLRLGLTGNIGSGKSSVARLLASHGALVIDADELAREATNDPAVVEAIAARLGSELVVDGQLDRPTTAARVFSDPAALAELNAVVHPWVGERREQLEHEALRSENPPTVIVHDVPLLYETGLEQDVDEVVVVTAPLEARVARVVARSGLSAAEVRARDAAQLPLDAKAACADYVIDNGGDEAALQEQVARLWAELLAHRATEGSEL